MVRLTPDFDFVVLNYCQMLDFSSNIRIIKLHMDSCIITHTQNYLLLLFTLFLTYQEITLSLIQSYLVTAVAFP